MIFSRRSPLHFAISKGVALSLLDRGMYEEVIGKGFGLLRQQASYGLVVNLGISMNSESYNKGSLFNDKFCLYKACLFLINWVTILAIQVVNAYTEVS